MTAASNRSLGEIHQGERMPIVLMLLLALALLLAGWFRPFTRVTKLWVFDNDVSVYQALIALFREREIFLFGILVLFTVLFPFVKIITLLALWLKPGMDRRQMARVHNLVAHLGKWSMLDVFVVAVLVVLIRAGGLATIKAQDGLLIFCASVVLTQIASEWTGRIAKRTFDKAD